MAEPAAEAAHPTLKVDLARLDRSGFDQLYNERIEPVFRDNEDDRLAAVATFQKRLWIGAPIVLVLAAAIYLWSREVWFAFIVAAIGGIVLYAIAYAPLAGVGHRVKRAYCAAIADAMGADFRLQGFTPPALDRLKKLRLLPDYSRSRFEDLFSGAYRDAEFDIYEGHLEQRHTDSKGRTRYTTVFRGQLVRMKFPRDFLGVTIVRRDAGVFNVFGGGKNLERVRLVDPAFEKAFEVWGTDQVEARYLLHPVLMQRLLDMEARLAGKRLRCAFEAGDLLVAVEGGNLFEPGDLFTPLIDPARALRIVDEIASVVRVMEEVLTAQAAKVKR